MKEERKEEQFGQLLLFCSTHLGLLLFISEPVNVLPGPKKERPTKLETKSQPKASSRKTSNSSSKKDKNSVASACEPSEEVSSPDKCHPPSRCSHEHKGFQRTLSPADVLHVHSYAKGDYGEGEIHCKEEKSENSEIKAERDKRLGRLVSACTHVLLTQLFCLQQLGTNSVCVPSAGGRDGYQ